MCCKQGKRNRLNGWVWAERRGHVRYDRADNFVAIALIATGIEPRRRRWVLVEGNDHATRLDATQDGIVVFLKGTRILSARQGVLANSQWFEVGPKSKVIALCDRVVFVIVAVRAIERQTEERLAGV